MNTKKTLDSYKQNFKSPLGAYVYMLMNQRFPEFFTLSSDENNTLSENLESILMNAEDMNSIIKCITSIPNQQIESIQLESTENDLSKDNVLTVIGNLKYAQIDFNSWEELNGIIEYNQFSQFIKDKEPLRKKLQEFSQQYSLASFSLNPNFQPNEFIENFHNSIIPICDALKIKPQQIGLNHLHLNYKTQYGDFTGYVHYSKKENSDNNRLMNKMIINKPEVFAHEWMHFIDSSLGMFGWSLTQLMDATEHLEKIKKLFSDYTEIFKFKDTILKKEDSYSDRNFSNSIQSAAHFFERYALDSFSFYQNIENISEQFKENYKNGMDKKQCLNEIEHSISALLIEPHPTRYFSFIKAQCEIYIDKEKNQSLERNQLMDFSKKADEHLQLDNYTQSTIEVFARSFESFLFDKLKQSNSTSSLISSSYDSDYYPQANMRTNLNELWEKMLPTIKKEIDNACPVGKENDKTLVLNNILEFRKKITQAEKKDKKFRNYSQNT